MDIQRHAFGRFVEFAVSAGAEHNRFCLDQDEFAGSDVKAGGPDDPPARGQKLGDDGVFDKGDPGTPLNFIHAGIGETIIFSCRPGAHLFEHFGGFRTGCPEEILIGQPAPCLQESLETFLYLTFWDVLVLDGHLLPAAVFSPATLEVRGATACGSRRSRLAYASLVDDDDLRPMPVRFYGCPRCRAASTDDENICLHTLHSLILFMRGNDLLSHLLAHWCLTSICLLTW